MSINIGDDNKFNKSNVGHSYNSTPPKENFFTNHPFILGVIVLVVGSFIMMFTFWGTVIVWIENLFK